MPFYCIFTTSCRQRPCSSFILYNLSSGSGCNVRTNIALAAGKLNGTIILQPGEVFSFNCVVGDGSAANGFSSLEGCCIWITLHMNQVVAYARCHLLSLTLLLAGCSITERHRHSRPVRYVPLGLDATIRYGKKDLRMKNTTPSPLYIFTSINDKSLTIMIKKRKNTTAQLRNLY